MTDRGAFVVPIGSSARAALETCETNLVPDSTLVASGTAALHSISELPEGYDQPDLDIRRSSDQRQINYEEAYSEVFAIRDEVSAQIVKCREKLKLPVEDITPSPNWKELDASVENACNDIQNLAPRNDTLKGTAGKLKKAFNLLCKHAGAGETFVSIIPTDQFGFASVLCGGLKTIFAALKHTHEHREKVYQALEDLPITICDHSIPLNDKIQDEELHRRAAALHAAVFKVIRRILDWWLSKPIVLILKTVSNPSGLLSNLQEDLDLVKIKASQFQKRALAIAQSLQRHMLQLEVWLVRKAHEKDAQDQAFRVWSVQNAHEADAKIEAIRDELRRMNEKASRGDSLERLGNGVQTIQANGIPQPTREPRIEHAWQTKTNIDTMLVDFCYEQDLVQNDCQALIKLIGPQRGRFASSGRLRAIESNIRIQAWLVIDEPSLLLVDGGAQSRREMEMSIFVARIIKELHDWKAEAMNTEEGSPIFIPLAFFCSQHRDRQGDPHSNSTELGMSLLLQLIDQYRDGFKTSLIQRVEKTLDPRNMSSICSALEKLVIELDENVILILTIDGLVHFTQDEMQSGQIRELILSLIAIYRRRPAATLKFLFTSPTRPDFVDDLFLEKEVLHLPRNISSSHSPNNMPWRKPLEFRTKED